MTQLDSKRLMKAGEMRGLGSKVLFNFDDLKEKCDEQIRRIRVQAEQILAEANTKAAQTQEKGAEIGYKRGYQAGLEKAEQDLDARLQQQVAQQFDQSFREALPPLQQAADTLIADRDQWLSHWETSAVRLSVAIAEKILKQKLAANPELMLETTREALRLAAGSPQIQLCVNPRDLEILSARLTDITRTMAGLGEVQMIPDPNVSRGGCIVHTRHGSIDSQLETQLQRIASELMH